MRLITVRRGLENLKKWAAEGIVVPGKAGS